jgi:general stress protein 26
MTTDETRKVAELLKDQRFGMFTTTAPDGTLLSRPMAMQEASSCSRWRPSRRSTGSPRRS